MTSILEALASKAYRTSVSAPENDALVNSFADSIAKVLAKTAKALPVSRLSRAVQHAVTTFEAADFSDVELVIGEWLDEFDDEMEAVLAAGLQSSTAAGVKAQVSELIDALGLDAAPRPAEGYISQSIIDQTRLRAGELIVDIDETTRKRIANIVANGLQDQAGIDGIMRNIRDFVNDDQFTKDRARTIARTETNIALSDGSRAAAAATGCGEKEWITVGDSKVDENVCAPNERQGRIPFDEPWETGWMNTPGHPNCRCVVAYFGADPQKVLAMAEQGE